MAKISAAQVKELRDKTGVGMMDAKKALVAVEGDMEKAIDFLREKGMAKAAKKSDRVAAEGLANVAVNGNKAVIVEVNAETDFVAQNDQFKALVKHIADVIAENTPADVEAALQLKTDKGTLNDELIEATQVIGEKISLRRFEVVEKADADNFGAYLHDGGRIAVLSVVEGADEATAKDVAMHVAAINPKYVNRDEVPEAEVAHEKEIDLLNEVLTEKNKTADILLRLAPGIHAETHEYISTGQAKSKFGFDLQSGQASEALEKTLANPRFKVLGVHSHIGSQIFATTGFVEAAKKLMDFLSAWKEKYDFTAEVLNLGGGFGIRYTDQDEPLDVKDFVKIIVEAVKEKSKELNYPIPAIWIEPGRSVVGEAGVSLYTVGSRKDVEGVGSFVAVDGGMGDNIRPALYGAEYDAVLAKDPNAPIAQNASIVGKFCESGDILIKDYDFPKTEPGDVIAMLSTGAYGYVMASNYNRNPRPAIVFVEDGKARLVVKRESYEDMIRNEIL